MDEDAFLTNAALGTDLATSYAGATDDDPQPSRKPKKAGYLTAVLLVVGIVAWVVIRAMGL